MNDLHQRALRALVALQVAVIEHADEDVLENKVIQAMTDCNREWQKIFKEFQRS